MADSIDPFYQQYRWPEEYRMATHVRELQRENYGLLLMLREQLGDVSAVALRATAESKAREALGITAAADTAERELDEAQAELRLATAQNEDVSEWQDLARRFEHERDEARARIEALELELHHARSTLTQKLNDAECSSRSADVVIAAYEAKDQAEHERDALRRVLRSAWELFENSGAMREPCGSTGNDKLDELAGLLDEHATLRGADDGRAR